MTRAFLRTDGSCLSGKDLKLGDLLAARMGDWSGRLGALGMSGLEVRSKPQFGYKYWTCELVGHPVLVLAVVGRKCSVSSVDVHLVS